MPLPPILAVLALVLALVGPAAGVPHDERPDLRITTGGVSVSGATVSGTVTVRNRGATTARSTRLSLVVGGVTARFSVRRLPPGRQVRVPVSVSVVPGTFPVRACADVKRVVAELTERNNCRSFGTVVVPGGPPPSTVPTAPITYQPGVPLLVGTAPYDYYLQVPPSYDASHQTPGRLVVFLHGCYDSAANQMGSLRDTVPLAAVDYLVMVPRLGRDGACWDYAADPGAVRDALADVATHVNVDPRRTVVGGYSSGALVAGQVALGDVSSYAGLLVMMGSPFTSHANRSALLAAASARLPVAWRAHTGDATFPIAAVAEDRDALRSAGSPVSFSATSGTHLYESPDLAWLFAQIG